MVQFNHSLPFKRSDMPAQRSLRTVIDGLIDAHRAELQERCVSVECDVERPVAELRCQVLIQDCLQEILHTAIACSTLGSHLSVSAFRTVRGVEIEIADAASATDDMPTNAFSRCQRWSLRLRREAKGRWANSALPDVYHTRCPQGGQAWTLVMTPRMAQVRAA